MSLNLALSSHLVDLRGAAEAKRKIMLCKVPANADRKKIGQVIKPCQTL
jgi:hypothetical protein